MINIRWITFHRWLFKDEHKTDELTIERPDNAIWWHFGADSPLGANGFRTGNGRSWAATGFFEERAEAEGLLDVVSSQFSELPASVESFHCLLRPIRFSGVCNWLQPADAQLQVESDDPGGPLVVLTSAGYDDISEEHHARMHDFRQNVDKVREWYDTLDENIVTGNYATGADGMTFSLWRSDNAMRDSAYGSGVHRTQLDRQKAEKMADRTSYTRARMLRQFGTWNNQDLSDLSELCGDQVG